MMEFSGTDSDGESISVVSHWMATGRGRADATATDGTVSGTWTECWDDSFEETYDSKPWPIAAMPGASPIVRAIRHFALTFQHLSGENGALDQR